MILRASRPPTTSSAPAPSAKSAGAPIPPLAGSSFAGAGAGAGAGTGAGGGAALGGGGGAALGGSGSHGALATTPPAFASITPSLHSASAFSPPAPATLALASATTAGSSCARAGEAASRATATIAASIINFLNLTYLLLLESLFSCQRRILLKGSASKRAVTLLLRTLPLRLAGSRRGLVDLSVAGEDVLHVLVGRQRDLGVARRGDRTLASVLQALVEGLGVARIAHQLVVRTLDGVVALLGGRGALAKIGALGFLLALLRNLRYDRHGGQGEHRQKCC